MNGFIKINDPILVDGLKEHGFTPFSQEESVWVYTKNDKILVLLNEQFSGEDFFIDNKLKF